ncbi:Hypothetical protein D9617_2g059810 [Elsinoe fawcettii]|nr:Hypothetical protein D9617_2g059810 [Elsinoe fawcettii]
MSRYPNDINSSSGWQHPFLRGLSELRQQTDSSDLTILCGSSTHRVHKLVCGLQSEYFRAACKPDRFAEGQSHIVTLKSVKDQGDVEGADDPNAVEAMLDFFYGSESYHRTDKTGVGLLLHLAGLYIVADKYRVSAMREDVLKHFRRALEEQRKTDGAGLGKVLKRLRDNLPSAEDQIVTVLAEFIVCCKSNILRRIEMEELLRTPQVGLKFLSIFTKWCCWPAKNQRLEQKLIPEKYLPDERGSDGIRWYSSVPPRCRCEDAWEKMINPKVKPAVMEEPEDTQSTW